MTDALSRKYRQVVKTERDVFKFGKHKDETVRQVLLSDPGYILWLYEKEIVDFPEDIIIDAEERDDNGYGYSTSGVDPSDYYEVLD